MEVPRSITFCTQYDNGRKDSDTVRHDLDYDLGSHGKLPMWLVYLQALTPCLS